MKITTLSWNVNGVRAAVSLCHLEEARRKIFLTENYLKYMFSKLKMVILRKILRFAQNDKCVL
ncbi:hypothetical protein HN481_04475 [Candidatus Parcubacteria bacterium]|jgi:hypothetical protein|nr:hypothetical protein [Candidatus Parcubacteria bacterium]